MLSNKVGIKDGRFVSKVTDTIYKSFMLYKAGANEFEAKSNIDGTTYNGSLDDVKRQIDKYWEKKDAEEVLKAQNKDYMSPGAGLEERKKQKEILRNKYPDYNPVRHDVFVSRYNKEEQENAEKQYRINRGIDVKDGDEYAGVGKHNDTPDEDFDQDQLAMGIEIEKEHTDNEDIAKAIAKDHLSEMPDYYTKLKQMEGK